MPWLEVEDPISACNGQPEGWLNRVCKGKWRGVGERALRGPYHVLESSSYPNLKKLMGFLFLDGVAQPYPAV